MGILPGCLGTFAAVSLYVHRIFSFAALVTLMIATSGDEIFVMFAMMPGKTPLLLIILLAVAIIAGLIISFFTKKNYMPENSNIHTQLYNNEPKCFNKSIITLQLKEISFHRALLLTGALLFIVFLITGDIGPKEWEWEKITFLIVSIIGFLIVLSVTDHFLTKHVWNHIIKKHLLKIFLWTFGAFALIHLLEDYININTAIQDNVWIVLLVAVLIGIIPESGPHIIFISLFVAGTIPFSILIANSIVQDGHGSIPLLAESRKSFLYMKLLNVLVGLLVGGVLILFNL